jgi:hypothetical protein
MKLIALMSVLTVVSCCTGLAGAQPLEDTSRSFEDIKQAARKIKEGSSQALTEKAESEADRGRVELEKRHGVSLKTPAFIARDEIRYAVYRDGAKLGEISVIVLPPHPDPLGELDRSLGRLLLEKKYDVSLREPAFTSKCPCIEYDVFRNDARLGMITVNVLPPPPNLWGEMELQLVRLLPPVRSDSDDEAPRAAALEKRYGVRLQPIQLRCPCRAYEVSRDGFSLGMIKVDLVPSGPLPWGKLEEQLSALASKR